MSRYNVLTIQSAPEKSRSSLEQLQSAFGFIPNVAGAIANSPALIDALASVFATVHSGSFTEAEIQILLLTNAVTNKCEWAVAFHSTLAMQLGVGSDEVQSIRQVREPRDVRFAALSAFSKALIETRGHVQPQHTDAMTAAGFSDEQILTVIAVSAASTITNYAATLTDPPLEASFRANSWTSAG